MESVTCSIDIELTDNEHVFGDGWDCTIGIYQFEKVSDHIVRATFTYEDEVTRREPDGTLITGHDDYSERYVEVEENLQTLLDVITFQKSGIGLRLIPDSLEMRSSSMISHRSNQQFTIDLENLDEITARYERAISDHKDEVLDALRLNRLAANEENNAEKIGQLWGAVERLYASNPPKVLDTKAKRQEIYQLIDKATLLSAEDKQRLKNTVNNTYKTSKPSIIAERFGLIGGDGKEMSTEEIKEKLDYWLSTRSIQSHGEILMRNQDVNMLAGEMEHIMETALSSVVKPSKYVFVVYKAENVDKDFLLSQRAVTKTDKSGYSYTPIHKFAAFNDMSDRLRYSLKSDSAEMYLVDYHTVTRVKKEGDEAVIVSDLDTKLGKLIEQLQSKLN